jgi:uncharacterized protein with GYD domain
MLWTMGDCDMVCVLDAEWPAQFDAFTEPA